MKDNVDVAGLPTTAGHPAFARQPAATAPAVQALVDAGAIVVGQDEPRPVRHRARRYPLAVRRRAATRTRPDHIAGGSSSGSAVAVAVGAADVGVATDTAGSGRVPAALCGIVGLKPTRGLVSTRGVVPAVAGLDCVSVLARSVGAAATALDLMAAFDADDPWSRQPPAGTPVVGPGPLRVGVPRRSISPGSTPPRRAAWAAALDALARLGAVTEVDLSPYLDAGALLYEGAFVAARWACVRPVPRVTSRRRRPDCQRRIVRAAARSRRRANWSRDLGRLQLLRRKVSYTFDGVDVVAVPTVGIAPTLAEVAADPVGVNTALGRFTNGTNLLDLCAAAVPAGQRADGIPFGITFLAPAFADALVTTAAARFAGEPDPPPPRWSGMGDGRRDRRAPHRPAAQPPADRPWRPAPARDDDGAASTGCTRSPTEPPKPGLVRVETGGAAIAAELWRLPRDRFGEFVLDVAAPLAIGTVELDDGSRHPGFLCEGVADDERSGHHPATAAGSPTEQEARR